MPEVVTTAAVSGRQYPRSTFAELTEHLLNSRSVPRSVLRSAGGGACAPAVIHSASNGTNDACKARDVGRGRDRSAGSRLRTFPSQKCGVGIGGNGVARHLRNQLARRLLQSRTCKPSMRGVAAGSVSPGRAAGRRQASRGRAPARRPPRSPTASHSVSAPMRLGRRLKRSAGCLAAPPVINGVLLCRLSPRPSPMNDRGDI